MIFTALLGELNDSGSSPNWTIEYPTASFEAEFYETAFTYVGDMKCARATIPTGHLACTCQQCGSEAEYVSD